MDLARYIAGVFSRWRNRSSASPDLAPHLVLGRRGEDLAARHLRRNGYKVLYRNYRAPRGGEIDIVCRHGATLVFVEVKTRTTREFGDPSEAVNKAKQKLITRGALSWLRLLHNPEVLFRFDIVEVIITADNVEIQILENAFQLPEPYIY
jgi:putative endonuclease